MMRKPRIATVTQLAGFRKPEIRSVTVQVRFTPSETRGLDEFVDFCRSHGVPEVTRSSALRALALDGIEVYQEESDG